MAKATRPTIIVGGGGNSGGFSMKLSSTQAKNVQQVLGKAKSAASKATASARSAKQGRK